MGIAAIAKGLISPLTDLYANRQSRIAKESEAKATMDQIYATATANDASVAGAIALVNAKNQNNTWKDEFALITIALPYWAAMLVGGFMGEAQVVTDMFAAMASVPEYWQETFQVAIWASLGITGFKKVLS
jgi:hypothetical protein